MATNKKITQLDELTPATWADDDVIAIVDISAQETKKIQLSTFRGAVAGVSSLNASTPLTVDSATGDVTISVAIDGGGTINAVFDEDNMASNSPTALATQQSIKAYVDSQVGTVDTLAEILANGNTSGGTNIVVSSGDVITTNTINETTAAAGVTIDGVLMKDGEVDGRDVSVDGTKLDTIETNADVTDTANVTAAGALMDSELTNITAVKALDQGVATTDTPTFAGVITAGNVDGRDVSADGAKLDGIEAGADVTDTANVTAAGALMDSELTNIAAVKALNQGVATTDSPSFAGLTATTADINGGTIDGTVIGGTTLAAISGTTITAAQYDSTEALPDIKPSLNLDFGNVKKLDPRITYTRASTGTYYDGVTFAKAEENLLIQSQDFTTSWTKVRTTASGDTETAPDGTVTADTITANAGTNSHYVQQTNTLGGTYVFSVFAKAGTNDYIQLAIGGDFDYANFDLATGTVGTTSGLVSSSITASTNGFYRCEIVITVTSGVSAIIALTDSSSATRLNSWTAAGTETVYLWGAQLEQRSALTDYTATTTQPITNYIPALQTAASGEARFDHDPLTGESLGFLIEEQRTNILTYSEDFSNAAWVKSNVTTVPNTVVAPDGTLTGDKIVEFTSNSEHYTQNLITFGAGTYTVSAYFKAAERNTIWFRPVHIGANEGGTSAAVINLLTGSITSLSGGAVSANIIDVGNGWKKVNLVFTITGTITSSAWRVQLYNGSPSYTGDGYSGIYIWGAQLEAGAFPTSYIKTVASQATRNADVASMTGTNFSSWYRQDEGTVFVEGSSVVNGIPYHISDGSSANDIRLYLTSSLTPAFRVRSFAVDQCNFSLSAPLSDPKFKGSVALANNDFVGSINGGPLNSDVSGTVPLVNQIKIGSFVSNATFINGHIRKLAYYPKRLSNATLQALTEE